ncbi:MAG: hypothetical protein P8Y70_11995 [Candidatus Lokiarchaeota archaeon]
MIINHIFSKFKELIKIFGNSFKKYQLKRFIVLFGKGIQNYKTLRIRKKFAEDIKLIIENPPKFRNEYEIRLFGMRRSGNHAIVVWIANHFSKPIMFLNNIQQFSDPYLSNYDRRVLDNCINFWERPIELNRYMKKSCLLFSYENFDLRLLKDKELIPNKELRIGTSGRIYNILIIRDPFNLLASRIKSNDLKYKKDTLNDPEWILKYRSFLKLWKIHAKEFTGITNYLGFKIKINYNKWFKDKIYRKSISKSLNLEFTDKGLNLVPKTGGGSSFNGRIYNGSAQNMKIETRWKNFSDNLTFKKLLDDPEIWNLSEKIFSNLNGITKELKLD